jgi:N-acetylglucosamine-6-phosphate deacetylase
MEIVDQHAGVRSPNPQPRHLGVAATLLGGELVDGDLEIADGRITAVGLPGPGRGVAIPGLVDLQVNGYVGVDFAAAGPDDYRRAERALLADGVTAYQPTITSAPQEDLLAALERASRAIAGWVPGGARPIGVHLEGPFLSPTRPGVHPPSAIRDPELQLAELLCQAPVTFMTVAPERPGAPALIRWLRARGVTVACGHSNATYDEAVVGFEAGATAVTHLFNAMRPLRHRDPGIVGAALLHPNVFLGLIADCVHVAPEVLEIVRRLAAKRVYLVTDAVAALGAPDGRYRIGAVDVRRKADRVHDTSGRLGGGLTPLLTCVRGLVEAGGSLAWTVQAASGAPARIIGRPELGSLQKGGWADLVVLDDTLQPLRVFSRGDEAATA